MAYNDTIKLRAYSYFLQGNNYEEIALRVKDEFSLHTLKGATIKSWAERDNWLQERINIRNTIRQSISESSRNKLQDIQEKTETITTKLYDAIVEQVKPKISSYEGAVYAFKTISEYGLKLDDKSKQHINPLLIVQSLLDILSEIPEVRKAIKKNWKDIQHGIEGIIFNQGNRENKRIT